jgi:hypothetical protein
MLKPFLSIKMKSFRAVPPPQGSMPQTAFVITDGGTKKLECSLSNVFGNSLIFLSVTIGMLFVIDNRFLGIGLHMECL